MKKSLTLLILILFMTIGCAKENRKPSQDSILTIKAFEHISALKEAYEGKDRAVINQLSSDMSEQIMRELSFDKAELSFIKRLVRITDTSVIVNLNWRGSWWVGTNKIENRGVADFILHKETVTLSRIEGDNPFIVPLTKNLMGG
jgi:hypothetical protein